MMLEKLILEMSTFCYAYRGTIDGAYDYLLRKGVPPYEEGKEACVNKVIEFLNQR
jgi:hypothetical protein